MGGFPCIALILAVSLCHASSFVVQIPSPSRAGTLPTGSERVLRLQHVRTTPSLMPGAEQATGRSQQTATTIMMASRNGKGGQEEEEESEEKSRGIEPKYLAAIGVFTLAALYDLFVTHQGRLWEL